MKSIRLLPAFLLIATTAITACTRDDAAQAPAPAQASPAPSQAAGVNAPIHHRDIDLGLSVAGTPSYDAASDTLQYTLTVANNGKATIASQGSHPVNLGVVVLGSDGTLATAPARQDFVRVRLPRAIAPGEKLDVALRFKVAPTLGGTVIVDGVQERVAWFRGYKKPVLTLGTFARCEGDAQTVCTSDGVAIAAAQ